VNRRLRAVVDPFVSDIVDYDPGSPEAIAAGCTCSPVLNNDGAGNLGQDGRARFVCDQGCPLHGLAVLKRALEDGEAQIIDAPDAEDDAATKPSPPTVH